MNPHTPTGWNTWDYRGFNRLVYLDRGRTRIIVQFAVWDETVPPPSKDSRKLGELYDAYRWDHARRIGPHAPLGLPAQLEFTAGNTPFRMAAAADGDRLRLTVEPLASTPMRVVFLLLEPDGERVIPASESSGSFAGWRIDLSGAAWPRHYFLNVAHPYAIGEPGAGATIAIARRVIAGSEPDASVDVTAAVESYAQTSLAGGGALADALQAMIQAVTWNTHFDTRRRLVSSPVSRDWCIDWRGPIIFGWDSFFAALMASMQSPDLARANVEAVLAGVDELGFVPNYFMAHGAASLDRSMPCIGSYMVRKIEQLDPDVDWLRKVYPRLRRWHRFWMKHRDGRGDGLLSWGSNPTPHYEFPQLLPYNPSLQHTAKCAMYEAGLDNSPMYDDVPFNPQASTFELADVLLCSYYAMDCEALAWIADTIGRKNDAAAYRREHTAMAHRINNFLWDDECGIYANRHWDGRHSTRWSPSSFFPMIAGVPDREKAERLVRDHLLNESEFWGTYVVPSIARSDPAFGENDYWRGRIWGPFNFLVAEGLRRYRFDDEAAALAQRGLDMFLRNWHDDGGIYENYNANTGRGGDVWNAARLYHWGGLLAVIAMQELIDVEPTGRLRIGSLAMPAASLEGLNVARRRYDVRLGHGVEADCDGQPLLRCSTRAIIRVPLDAPSDEPVDVRATAAARLSLHGPLASRSGDRPVRINGRPGPSPIRTADGVEYTWSAADAGA